MDDSAKSESENIKVNPQDEHNDQQKILTDIVNAHENKENLEKLAGKLSALWSEQDDSSKKPDLSFSKFQEKLKKNKR